MIRVAVLCHQLRGTALAWRVRIHVLPHTGDMSAPRMIARRGYRMDRVGGQSVTQIVTKAAERGKAWILRAKQSWIARWIPSLVTVLAVAYIVLMIPWRDSVTEHPHLGQGSSAQSNHPIGEVSPLRHDPNQQIQIQPGVVTLLGRIRWPWIVAYLLCMIASGSLLVVRWHTLLKRSGTIEVSLAWCARAWAQAQVVSLLPIGQVGADAFRVERSSRLGGAMGRCVGIVAVERLFGLMALVLVASTGFALMQRSYLGVLILCTVFLIEIFLVQILGGAGTYQVKDPSNKAPSRLQKVIRDTIGPLRPIARPSVHGAQILLLSLAIQTMTPLTMSVVDRALGLDTPVHCYFLAMPLVLIVQFLPIHIAGIGILEGGLWVFLSRAANRTSAEILAISSTARILSLIWMMGLALAFVIPRRQSRYEHLAECIMNAKDDGALGVANG